MKTIFCVCFLFIIFSVKAQFVNIHEFSTDNNLIGQVSGLVSDGTFLYGMTSIGGMRGVGTIYRMNLDGTGITFLHEFNGIDGHSPDNALIISDTMLYGLTNCGGVNELGVIFKISVNGNGFTKLLDFDGENGGYSYCSLALTGDTLFGLSTSGGTYKKGTIFKLNTDGSGFSKLHDFNMNIGYWPYGALCVTDSVLYGTTRQGGNADAGVVFSIHRDGTSYKLLYDFDKVNGSNPTGTLVLSDNVLYGLTQHGGSSDNGTIFQIELSGGGFSKIHEFNFTNGGTPAGSLSLAGPHLFGMTSSGGPLSGGVIFKIGLNGKDFTIIRNLGECPLLECKPLLLGPSIYGITRLGGVKDWGVIFKCDTSGLDYSYLINIGSSTNGATPVGSLVSDGEHIYGLTSSGGQYGKGVIYKLNTDGTEFSVMMHFKREHGYMEERNTLVLSDSTLFWTSTNGGKFENGAIYSIRTNGEDFRSVFDFEGPNGSAPFGVLEIEDSVLYGVTNWGGAKQLGVIYKVKKDGSDFSVLKDLSAINYQPQGSVTLDDSWLYGSAYDWITESTDGIIFKIKTDGSNFTKLLEFNMENGAFPREKLAVVGPDIYGTTNYGLEGNGQIFKISKDGSGFKKIVTLNPRGSLTLYNNLLYGTTVNGGAYGYGSLYKINLDGTGYSSLIDFQIDFPGELTGLQILLDNNTLYGINNCGNDYSIGSLFSYSLPPYIKTQPKEKIAVCENGNSKINIDVLGKDLNYQWQVSNDTGIIWEDIMATGIGPDYAGWNTSSLIMQNIFPENAGIVFRCVVVDKFGRTDTSITAMLELNVPIQIIKNPEDTTICDGFEAGFYISASGLFPEYQWQEGAGGIWQDITDGKGFSGSESNILKANKPATQNNYYFRCIIYGSCGETDTSGVSKLTVQSSPSITQQPNIAEVCEGYNSAIQILAKGTGLSYQWQASNGNGWTDVMDDNVYSGSNSDSIALNNVSIEMNGFAYRCIISGECPPIDTSDTVTLTVLPVTSIFEQPEDADFVEGGDTSFSIQAIGENLNYQWEKYNNQETVWEIISDDITYLGSMTSSLRVNDISGEMSGSEYRCIVTGGCGFPEVSKVVLLKLYLNTAFKTFPGFVPLKLSPNPSKTECVLYFSCPAMGEVTTSIYSLTGHKIAAVKSLKTSENYSGKIIVSELTPGIYYFIVRINNASFGGGKLIVD
jgi:uncharacterized repeat protein (TIGR03803 family)